MGRSKRLDPYTKDGKTYEDDDFLKGGKITKKSREDRRIANRNLKKSKRQELKREVNKLIEGEEE